MEPLPPDVRRTDDVTAAHLGGCTPAELAAFRMACLQTELHLEVEERVAILVVYGDGEGWKERVADIVPIGWGAIHGTLDLRPPGLRAAESNRTPDPGRMQP